MNSFKNGPFSLGCAKNWPHHWLNIPEMILNLNQYLTLSPSDINIKSVAADLRKTWRPGFQFYVLLQTANGSAIEVWRFR